MVISQGEVWWADLAEPGLPRDSVANVSQIVALDRTLLAERVGKLSRAKIELLLSGVDIVLGRG